MSWYGFPGGPFSISSRKDLVVPINSFITFEIECDDCCETMVDSCDGNLFLELKDAIEQAKSLGWLNENYKWFCPGCIKEFHSSAPLPKGET